MVSNNKSYCEALREHYVQCWAIEPEVVHFNRGPIHDLPGGFRIFKFAPNEVHAMWTYATSCMSQEDDELRLELHMFASKQNDDLSELLVATAHYHRTGKQLGLGHSINFGRPWWIHSQCDRGLISAPYLDGPKLEWLEYKGKKVRFLWLIPVTNSEVDFKKKFGLEALEKRFEEVPFDYLNPLRPSVV